MSQLLFSRLKQQPLKAKHELLFQYLINLTYSDYLDFKDRIDPFLDSIWDDLLQERFPEAWEALTTTDYDSQQAMLLLLQLSEQDPEQLAALLEQGDDQAWLDLLSPSYLTQLPSELLTSEVFTTLSYQDIKNLCSTDTTFATYCAKDNWIHIFRAKYSEVYAIASRYQARGVVKDYENIVKQMERIANNEVEKVKPLTLEMVIYPYLKKDYFYDWHKLFKHTDHTEALLSTKYLLSLEDERIDTSDEDNYAFRTAATNGHVKVLQFLIDLGDYRIDPSVSDNVAFRWAAENGHIEVLQFLMGLGDDRIDPSASNNYAFKWAEHMNHVEVLRFLTDLKDDRIRI